MSKDFTKRTNLDKLNKNTPNETYDHKGVETMVNNDELKTYSVVLPKQLHQTIKLMASAQGISLSQLMRNILSDYAEENQEALASFHKVSSQFK